MGSALSTQKTGLTRCLSVHLKTKEKKSYLTDSNHIIMRKGVAVINCFKRQRHYGAKVDFIRFYFLLGLKQADNIIITE